MVLFTAWGGLLPQAAAREERRSKTQVASEKA